MWISFLSPHPRIFSRWYRPCISPVLGSEKPIHFWPEKERHSGQPVSRYWRHQLAGRVYRNSPSLLRRLVPKSSACPPEWHRDQLQFRLPGSRFSRTSWYAIRVDGNPGLELPSCPASLTVKFKHHTPTHLHGMSSATSENQSPELSPSHRVSSPSSSPISSPFRPADDR